MSPGGFVEEDSTTTQSLQWSRGTEKDKEIVMAESTTNSWIPAP